MNNGYVAIGIIAVILVLALFQVFASAQAINAPSDVSQTTDELSCGSCCGGNCESCCANGVCSKVAKGTSSCGC